MLDEKTSSGGAEQSATRNGASRKFLTRKARETTALHTGPTVQDSFPAAVERPDGALPLVASAALDGSSSVVAVALAQPPAPPALWSSEDESSFQALSARRKAAGYQRRGKDVSAQTLQPGTIKPNADTVVATIVDIVTERGQLARAELVGLMSATTFPHLKAQPTDKGWCQGYVAGAIRNGFLAVASAAPEREA